MGPYKPLLLGWVSHPLTQGTNGSLDPSTNENQFENPQKKTHLANGPWNKSLNFIFPTKYRIPKSLKG